MKHHDNEATDRIMGPAFAAMTQLIAGELAPQSAAVVMCAALRDMLLLRGEDATPEALRSAADSLLRTYERDIDRMKEMMRACGIELHRIAAQAEREDKPPS